MVRTCGEDEGKQLVKKVIKVDVYDRRSRGRPERLWGEILGDDLRVKGVTSENVLCCVHSGEQPSSESQLTHRNVENGRET